MQYTRALPWLVPICSDEAFDGDGDTSSRSYSIKARAATILSVVIGEMDENYYSRLEKADR